MGNHLDNWLGDQTHEYVRQIKWSQYQSAPVFISLTKYSILCTDVNKHCTQAVIYYIVILRSAQPKEKKQNKTKQKLDKAKQIAFLLNRGLL